MRTKVAFAAILIVAVCGFALPAFGQGYGTDTQNVMTPAAGGMAGVSAARPQDVPAAIFGNPSTLSQFEGTQFTLGGGWVEGYPTVTSVGAGGPFSATSRTQGFAAFEIGVTQDLRSRNLPGTVGIGVAGLSGLGAQYRGRAPESELVNNISGEYLVLGVNLGAGFDVTERLSVGASATLGTGFEQMGFVQLPPPAAQNLGSTAMVHDYALRATLGADYDLTPCDTLAVYYQTKLGFTFPDAVLVNGEYRDLPIDQPETVGFGYANRSLLDGDLLIAADVYYKLWEDAALWQDVYVNQWAFALGAQLTRGRNKFRAGYSYNSNPLNHNVGNSLDGFPVLQSQIQLFQAASTATILQHRITAGIGRQDVLIQGLDLDLFGGVLLKAEDSFGNSTASVAAYYLGTGLTWRFGACGESVAEK